MADWEQIRNEHGPAVWGVVYRILAHYEDARDCQQEVFFEAFRSHQSTDVQNWHGHLCWLATRRAIDRLRTRKRQATTPFVCEPIDPIPQNLLEQSETVTIVREELAKLPDAQATAFWLASVEQLTYVEVAEQMQTTTNAVGLLIYRARLQLKQQLRHLADERSKHV